MSHSFESLRNEELPPNTKLIRTTKASFEVTAEGHMRYVRELFQDIDGDDDLEPYVILDFEDAAMIVPIGLFFVSEVHKEILAQVILPGLIDVFEPWCVSLVTPSWAIFEKFDEMSKEDYKKAKTWSDLGVAPPSQHPNRVEVLTIDVRTAHESGTWMAKVRRRKNRKPQLRKFIRFDKGAFVGGRFPEAIQRGLASLGDRQ